MHMHPVPKRWHPRAAIKRHVLDKQQPAFPSQLQAGCPVLRHIQFPAADAVYAHAHVQDSIIHKLQLLNYEREFCKRK